MVLDHILHAGPVAMILLALSVLALAVLLERLWVQLRYPLFIDKQYRRCQRLLAKKDFASLEQFTGQYSRGWPAAVALLAANSGIDKEIRQGILRSWLQIQSRYLNSRIKMLGLIGMLAPLLGLLGTVFGIIEMFKAIAHNTGPVTPALLAEGMWTAMVTTALGLIVAIPALAASHGLEQLTQLRLARIQEGLNELEFIQLKQQAGVFPGQQDEIKRSEQTVEKPNAASFAGQADYQSAQLTAETA